MNRNDKNTVVLYLTDEELNRVKDLAHLLEMTDYEAIRYCLRLVCWWSNNEIEP